MSPLQILAAGGATLALAAAAVLFVFIWAGAIDMAKRFGLRDAVPALAIAVGVTGAVLFFLAVIIQEAPRAFGAI